MSLDVQTSPTVDSNRLGESVADLLERLGDVPARRVRLHPWPGTATEQDVAGIEEREKRLFELVEGVLVEKDMGFVESYLASELLRLLGNYVVEHNLGIVLGPDGMMRLARGLVRIPDVSFFSWDRLPGGTIPTEPVPELAPDLAVEVLSAGNTQREMERKLQEYFRAGVRLVWYADPSARAVRVYTAPETMIQVEADQILDGGAVLPGFSLRVRDWFARLDRARGN